MDSLVAYLASLSEGELAEVTAHRPESTVPPPPRDLPQLAARLRMDHSVVAALVRLNRPALQAAQALTALGSGCTVAELAAALGVAEDDAHLAGSLTELRRLTIAWPDVRTARCGHPSCSGIATVPLRDVWPMPHGLGPPVVDLLSLRRPAEVRAVAGALGLPPGGDDDVFIELAAWLRDATNVRRLVAGAPADTRALLTRLATDGPYRYPGERGQPQAATWALARGLLGRDRYWDSPLIMPAEVAIALRGPAYHLPFDPVPPTGVTVEVSSEAVEREAAAAAATALARIAAVLEECSRTPLALLRSGGVGVRELRRLAKVTGDGEENVRLWLELAFAADLIGVGEGGAVPTDEYDHWQQCEPAEQLVVVLESWRDMAAAPLCPAPPEGPRAAPLAVVPDAALVVDLRAATLAIAASLPPGAAVPGVGDMVELVSWLRPVPADAVGNLAGQVGGAWREANLLGLVAHDAPTNLGLALADGDRSTMVAVARRMLPEARGTVMLQADLTAVVTGPPAAALMEVLDRGADRESSGGAWTWRFTAASVTRAFDSGATGADLLGALRGVAVGGALPQPLEYLITDVERRHGAIRVRPVGCVVHCTDEALLAEILNTRALFRLRLTALAPTVLASALPTAETLAALRAAGYAPAGENADGSRAVELAPRQRAQPAPWRLGGVTPPTGRRRRRY